MLKTAKPRFSPAPRQRFARLPSKVADPHYSTPEHKAWAKDIVKAAGYRCQDCGSSSPPLYADHVIEVKDNPALALDRSNGRARCARCHGIKTAAARAARLHPNA